MCSVKRAVLSEMVSLVSVKAIGVGVLLFEGVACWSGGEVGGGGCGEGEEGVGWGTGAVVSRRGVSVVLCDQYSRV